MNDTVKTFLKGSLMGICDIIPGISGGTIAFITGIYLTLIGSVNACTDFGIILLKNNFGFSRKKRSIIIQSFKKINFKFLITLGVGIGTAMVLMSWLVSFLLENYFQYTLSFFIGLIIASSLTIFKHIDEHNFSNYIFLILGIGFGIYLSIAIPLTVNVSYLYVFFGGFFAISAMFLPGISGAFILLILGIYDFMLNVLHGITDNILYFLTFGFGAALGAISISKIVEFLFQKDKSKTLYTLLGLVVGCLSIPVKKIILETPVFDVSSVAIMFLLFFLGFVFVFGIQKFEISKK